jgi:chromatin structure-remodeling complex subunit RSC1/2
LNDHANASIPPEIREQFQRDEQGRILFFTAPPLNTPTFAKNADQILGHSARYLAAKAQRDAKIAAKRKAEEASLAERGEAAKKEKAKAEEEERDAIANLSTKAIEALESQLAVMTKAQFEALFPDDKAADAMLSSIDRLSEVQRATIIKNLEREAKRAKERSNGHIPVTGMTVRLEEKY